MRVYEWNPASRVRTSAVAAQEVGEVIDRIEATEGACAPAALVDEARPPTSALHSLFEWDDTIAGERWRVEQARAIIRGIRILVDPESNSDTRLSIGFVSVALVGDEGVTRGYVSATRALTDHELRAQVEKDVLSQLQGLQRRYRRVETFEQVWTAIDEIAGSLEEKV